MFKQSNLQLWSAHERNNLHHQLTTKMKSNMVMLISTITNLEQADISSAQANVNTRLLTILLVSLLKDQISSIESLNDSVANGVLIIWSGMKTPNQRKINNYTLTQSPWSDPLSSLLSSPRFSSYHFATFKLVGIGKDLFFDTTLFQNILHCWIYCFH